MAVATPVRPGLKCLLLIAALLVLSGCGTINATLTDKEGREVMLLGHDPVAYFTLSSIAPAL